MPAESLDRARATPLWAQLEADLRRRLQANDFSDGNFLTDTELVNEYGVSRHTAREAVRRLSIDGLIRRERGRGTLVNRIEFEQSLGTLYSLFRSIEASGVEQTSDVLQLEVVRDSDAAAALKLQPQADLVLLSRLRHAGGEPLAIDRAWLPAAVASALLSVDWAHTALYDQLRVIGVGAPTHGRERLAAVSLSPQDSAQLECESGAAAFRLERIGFVDDTPIERRITVVRGDRFGFVAEWMSGSPSALRASPS